MVSFMFFVFLFSKLYSIHGQYANWRRGGSGVWEHNEVKYCKRLPR